MQDGFINIMAYFLFPDCFKNSVVMIFFMKYDSLTKSHCFLLPPRIQPKFSHCRLVLYLVSYVFDCLIQDVFEQISTLSATFFADYDSHQSSSLWMIFKGSNFLPNSSYDFRTFSNNFEQFLIIYFDKRRMKILRPGSIRFTNINF